MKFAIDTYIDSWDGMTAARMAERLTGLKDGEMLELSVNSPGGDVYEGIAIFNAIRETAKTHPVIVTINGLAASMASYIALAARTVDHNAVVKVLDNSIFMIHNPYTFGFGDYKNFEKTAEHQYNGFSVQVNRFFYIMGTSKNLSFLEVILRFNLRCFNLSHYDIKT